MSDAQQLRFLSFSLKEDEFAIPIQNIREVIGVSQLTPIPNSPNHFLGLMSLREEIIPVLDLRLKLGIEATLTNETAVVICDFKPNVVGVMVDSIDKVIDPEKGNVFALKDTPSQYNAEYVTHVIRKDKRLTLVLEIAKLLSNEDQVLIKTQNQTQEVQETKTENAVKAA
jgi:purine-binding chemotaxis protein CheW